MSRIKSLPPQMVAQIAAGEVVDRPAYAIKELVENALDASATQIAVHLQNAGIDRIVVTDNGTGMTREELEQSYRPHTTSKIETIEELQTLQTFGFRGEALSSIASVSLLTLKSRTADSVSGNQVVVQGGEQTSVSKAGMPRGTSVIVEDLFAKLPVRKTFLKRPAIELRLVIEVVTQLAMVHPAVSFRLTNNEEIILNLPVQTAQERLHQLLGSYSAAALLPVDAEVPYGRLSGYIGKPLSRGGNGKQYLFINNRPVFHEQLARTVKDAYGTLLEARNTPLFALFLTIPGAHLDINIHPRKQQVSLYNESDVLRHVQRAIFAVLTEHNLIAVTPDTELEMLRDGATSSYGAQVIRERVPLIGVDDLSLLEPETTITQIHNLYLLVETPRGLLMLDQHAAHERVMYEKYLNAFEKEREKHERFELPEPVLLELSVEDVQIVKEHDVNLDELDFTVEVLDQKQVLIREVPMVFQDRNVEMLLLELISDLGEGADGNIRGTLRSRIDSLTRRMLFFLACRSAIKAGDPLTQEQARTLVRELAKTKTPYVCPHGRPTQIELSLRDLERMFHRV
ncbi:MAG: DNA mismatch repair endonuclease MutL [Patescibacteria group bacterium]